MKRIIAALCLPLGIILCFGGCTLAPRYTRPAAPIPSKWPGGAAYKTQEPGAAAAAGIPWKDFFTDRRLKKLVGLALKNNRDLRVATLNIEKARALYQIQRSELFPLINGSSSWTKQRQLYPGSGSGQAMTSEQYNINLGTSSWEIDFFGRIRSMKEQALEQFLATKQARRSVQISLVAEVATAYLNLAADREQLRLSLDTLKTQQAAYKLIKSRFEAGVSSELDLRQAQTQVDAARTDVARYTTLSAQDENVLDLVVGAVVPAGLFPDALSGAITAVKDIAPGLPSDVLLKRPDIIQAEDLLKGANANIGAARADFFPRIALSTNIGTTSYQLSNLFKPGSDTWSFAPQAVFPVFDAGVLRANLKAAKVDRDIALAQYEKAIQTAFREVADALAQRGTIDEQMEAQRSLVDAAAATYRLSMARYEKGIDSYLTVLDSQRSLYGAQKGLVATRLTRLLNLVTLYKVLGGGGDAVSSQTP